MDKKKPPQSQGFDLLLLLSATFLGLSVAVLVFSLLEQFLFEPDSDVGDIIAATATAMGALTIGGIAVMQIRKHRWAEIQAQAEIDTRTGERLSQAIEHLGASGRDNLHIRVGAILEFERLAEDSERDQVRIAEILLRFLFTNLPSDGKLKKQDAIYDVDMALQVLSNIARKHIEIKRNKKNRKTKPPYWVYRATAVVSQTELNNVNLTLMAWSGIKANRLNLQDLQIKNADLFRANFRKSNLESVQFSGSSLDDANLSYANIKAADFTNTTLINTKFKGAIIDEHTKFDPGVREKYFPDFKPNENTPDS